MAFLFFKAMVFLNASNSSTIKSTITSFGQNMRKMAKVVKGTEWSPKLTSMEPTEPRAIKSFFR